MNINEKLKNERNEFGKLVSRGNQTYIEHIGYFHIAHTNFYKRQLLLAFSGVPMSNLAPMKNSFGVQGNLQPFIFK